MIAKSCFFWHLLCSWNHSFRLFACLRTRSTSPSTSLSCYNVCALRNWQLPNDAGAVASSRYVAISLYSYHLGLLTDSRLSLQHYFWKQICGFNIFQDYCAGRCKTKSSRHWNWNWNKVFQTSSVRLAIGAHEPARQDLDRRRQTELPQLWNRRFRHVSKPVSAARVTS